MSPSAQSRTPALLPGLGFLAIGFGLLGTGLFRHSLPAYFRPLLFELAAVLLVAAAGFLATAVTAGARQRGRFRPAPVVRHFTRPLPRALDKVRAWLYRAADRIVGIDWLGDWLAVLVAVLLSVLALFAGYRAWRLGGVMPPVARDQIIVGAMIALAFPLLVLERRFAGLRPAFATEGKSLAYLLRLLIFTLLGLGLAYALRWFALPFAAVVERVVLLFTLLVALELALRGASFIFLPLPPLPERRHGNSLIASLLRLQRPSLKAIQASVSGQFGIDLGRSWALGFIRRAIIPMAAGLVFSSWLMTGVTTLSLSERAVYEAFGNPQGVFHPGLHVYLPWPFGRLKPVEYGVVHQIPIAFLDEEIYGKAMAEKAVVEKSTIEGSQPASADRLWEASRPTEASYLVASNQNGRENFEVINVDLRIAYRIGLTDDAALSAAYSLESPDNLIRAAAGRMLARYFARYTLSAILGQDREAFIRNFQKELQARLNTLSTSIDVLSVVIETIHPPAGAAEAYQQVQAASIEAITKVANAKGDAVRDMRQAEADATEARDGATAMAAETVADAKVGTALFAGDAQAYRAGGQAFLFEKRLGILESAITAEIPVTILDARIPANQLQMLQMRPPASTTPGQ
jgi:regulator of protease activity HflC (stomatin/prohibitin superfamily)